MLQSCNMITPPAASRRGGNRPGIFKGGRGAGGLDIFVAFPASLREALLDSAMQQGQARCSS